MNAKKMRYCRCVFSKKGFPHVDVDFGYFSQEDKKDSIVRLRRMYYDHAFLKCYSITAPSWSRVIGERERGAK